MMWSYCSVLRCGPAPVGQAFLNKKRLYYSKKYTIWIQETKQVGNLTVHNFHFLWGELFRLLPWHRTLTHISVRKGLYTPNCLCGIPHYNSWFFVLKNFPCLLICNEDSLAEVELNQGRSRWKCYIHIFDWSFSMQISVLLTRPSDVEENSGSSHVPSAAQKMPELERKPNNWSTVGNYHGMHSLLDPCPLLANAYPKLLQTHFLYYKAHRVVNIWSLQIQNWSTYVATMLQQCSGHCKCQNWPREVKLLFLQQKGIQSLHTANTSMQGLNFEKTSKHNKQCWPQAHRLPHLQAKGPRFLQGCLLCFPAQASIMNNQP